MMKRFLNSAASGVIFALAALATTAFALQISGRNSERQRSIDQVGINALSTDVGVTATPSGTQANSYQVTAGFTYVSVVATIGDAIKMPSTTSFFPPTNVDAALNIIIVNGTANSMNIFPFLATEVMNKGGVASAPGALMALAAGQMADCWSTTFAPGKWYCQVG
jgi:hypothetical protein